VTQGVEPFYQDTPPPPAYDASRQDQNSDFDNQDIVEKKKKPALFVYFLSSKN
jgi:hypothetical protein